MSIAPLTDQIAELEQMLQARTDGQGNARKGYTANVVAIRTALANLRQQLPQQPEPPQAA